MLEENHRGPYYCVPQCHWPIDGMEWCVFWLRPRVGIICESSLRRDSSYKCYSREKPYSSRERYSGPSAVCYVCGIQNHYKKVCPEIECHKCYKKGHVSRECPLRESGVL